MSDDRCSDCGKDPRYIEIRAFGRPDAVHRIRHCCTPPPMAAQLARQADDNWLDRQRRLAEETT